MISSGRLLCGIAKCHSHLRPDIRHLARTLPPLHQALFLCSAASISEAPDENDSRHKKFKFRKRNKLNFQTSSEKEMKFSNLDPDTFGNLSGKKIIKEVEGDEGDIQEEEYLKNPPFKSQRLSSQEYAHIIIDFLKNKNIAEAIDVLETRMLKEDRAKPKNFIYTLLIGECGRLGYTQKAFQLFNQMKKRDLNVTQSTYTSLFNACANSPWSSDGLKRAKHLREIILEKGYEPNAQNYHAMIKAFGRCGDLETAFSLVDEMAEKKIFISDETFNFLFQACISDKEAGFRHAVLLWRKMINKKVKPNIYTYNLLLRAIRDCGLGDIDVAHDVFRQIEEEANKKIHIKRLKVPALEAGSGDAMVTLQPTAEENMSEVSSSVETVISQDKNQHDDTSVMLHEQENRPNLLAALPHFGNIIALTEVTRPEDRLLLVGGYSGFLEQMKKHKLKPDIKTFTQLLDTIPSTKSAEQALLSAMKKENIKPDIDFYNMLIKKRSMRFDYKSAHDVLKLIQRDRIPPDIVTYGVMALGCTTQEEAEQLISDMRSAGFRMNAEILGAMVRQGCAHYNFNYVLAIMDIVIEEEVRPNDAFLNHLEKFQKDCLKKIKRKDTDLPDKPKDSGKNYFINGFNKFCDRYAQWLTEIEVEKTEHPWDQFKKRPRNKDQNDLKERTSQQNRKVVTESL